MNDQVFIKELAARCHIGVSEREREKLQTLIVNVVLFSDPGKDYGSDKIEDCIDYGEMGRKIKSLVEVTTMHTLEALAEDIAQLCLSHLKVVRVLVRVEKRGIIKGIGSVGVQLERVKASF